MSAPGQQFGLVALNLSGLFDCREGALGVFLEVEDQNFGRITVDISTLPSARYQLKIALQPKDLKIAHTLRNFGFERRGNAIILEEITQIELAKKKRG